MVPALSGDGYPEFLRQYRLNAWEAFESLPMPTTSEEAWRRTDLRGLNPASYRLPAASDSANLPQAPAELLHPIADEAYGGQVLLLPGKVEATLDPKWAAKGVVFTDLATAGRQHPELLERILGKVVRPSEGKFAALAGALAQLGVLLYVPRNVRLDQPLQSILWGPGAGLAYISHLLVCVEDGASLTYVHEAASPDDSSGQTLESSGGRTLNPSSGQTLHAGLVEIHVGAGAHLRFVELQSWGSHVWNFSHERARVQRDGNLDWIFGALGSRLTKNFSDLDLLGEGSSGRMSGFYFTNGDQHMDLDTQQNHLAPHTTSDLLYKGALKDRSRSVWQGMIYVAPGAQKTDGYQANRNLTLSP